MPKLLISSKLLQIAEPLLKEYFDFDLYMFYDEIKQSVVDSGINYITPSENDGLPRVCFEETFYDNKELYFIAETPYEKSVQEHFKEYFDTQGDIPEDDIIVLICLTYMSYAYYKEREGLYYQSCIVSDINAGYELIMQKEIYPEILKLYRVILEAKEKKTRNSKVTLIYNNEKLDVNSFGWFIYDMEKYFADRFPNLTLEKINKIVPKPKPKGRGNKGGASFNDRIVTNMVWGTYWLLRKHSKFKDSKYEISKDMRHFINSYLDYIGAKNHYEENNNEIYRYPIGEILKHMKKNYIPQWDLPWRNVFSEVQEKQPENIFDRPLQRYPIYFEEAEIYLHSIVEKGKRKQKSKSKK